MIAQEAMMLTNGPDQAVGVVIQIGVSAFQCNGNNSTGNIGNYPPAKGDSGINIQASGHMRSIPIAEPASPNQHRIDEHCQKRSVSDDAMNRQRSLPSPQYHQDGRGYIKTDPTG